MIAARGLVVSCKLCDLLRSKTIVMIESTRIDSGKDANISLNDCGA